MKATIEKSLKGHRSNLSKWQHFNEILDAIQLSNSEVELRQNIGLVTDYGFFKYGFGSSHMWVHESKNNDRLLIIEF